MVTRTHAHTHTHTHTHATHARHTHTHTHTHTGARAAAVQAALAHHLEEDAPMASRRSYQVDPVISPSTSFDENGIAGQNSLASTPQRPHQQLLVRGRLWGRGL